MTDPIQFLVGADVQIRATCISCGCRFSMTTDAIYCVDCAEVEAIAPVDKYEDTVDADPVDPVSVDQL